MPLSGYMWWACYCGDYAQKRENSRRLSGIYASLGEAILCTRFVRASLLTLRIPRITSVVVLCGLDSIYYGTPTITPLNFALTNLSSVSLFYGFGAWHYYLTQAIPILCTTALPFVLHGVRLAIGPSGTASAREMLGLIAWTIAIYSLAGHKEWRFIHPLLPLFHVLAARSVVNLYYTEKRAKHGYRWHQLPVVRVCSVLMLLNVPALFYLTRVHGRAQVDVLYFFRSLPPVEVKSVGFVMPCHSTPWQAYLHRPTMDSNRFWALGCEPPLSYVTFVFHPSASCEFRFAIPGSSRCSCVLISYPYRDKNVTNYKDQTDVFYESPLSYFQHRFPPTVDPTFPPSPLPFSPPGRGSSDDRWAHEWPQYLVMFGALSEDTAIRPLLAKLGYTAVWHEERGWEGDSRRRGGVGVWRVR